MKFLGLKTKKRKRDSKFTTNCEILISHPVKERIELYLYMKNNSFLMGVHQQT